MRRSKRNRFASNRDIGSHKLRCIKTYYGYYYHGEIPLFIEGEIYNGFEAEILTRVYATPEYIEKYKYPHSTHFMPSEFEIHFIKLSEERDNKLKHILI